MSNGGLANRACQWLVIAGLMLVTTACMITDAFRQLEEIDSACLLSGQVVSSGDQEGPFVVVLLDGPASPKSGEHTSVDFFVMERPGDFAFAVGPGQYRLLAFLDRRGNLEFAQGDPAVTYPAQGSIDCPAGERVEGLSLQILAGESLDGHRPILLSRQRNGLIPGSIQEIFSLGQATSYGEVTTLDHSRFAMEVARDSLWRPVDFMRNGHPGIYFLDAYDSRKTPVLLVHGINGSPRVFADLIDQLDQTRFQPWLYYYPSAIGLTENADYLGNIMLELEVRHDIDKFHVIAHSMGGLVARAFLGKRAERGSPASVPLFIPLSAPWGGNAAAGQAVDSSPLVMPVWRDMAPGSEFLEQLWAPDFSLPPETETHLLFSYQGGEYLNWGSTDGVISLSSLLLLQAQDEADEILGINATHIGILSDPLALERINRILQR